MCVHLLKRLQQLFLKDTIFLQLHGGAEEFLHGSDFKTSYIEDAVNEFHYNKDKRIMREILRLFEDSKETEMNDEHTFTDMSVYRKSFGDIPRGYASKRNRRHGDVTARRHSKRSVFDSIAHSGEFGGFGKHKLQKLEFTFENLLPYLVNDMKRNRRQLPKRFLQK